MISKALRPAGRQSKHLKQISHLYLDGAQQTTSGDTPTPVSAPEDRTLSTGHSGPNVMTGLIALFTLWGVWGYHYLHSEHYLEKTKVTPAVIARTQLQEPAATVAVPHDSVDTLSDAEVAKVTPVAQTATEVSSRHNPEKPAASESARKGVTPYPLRHFRPPAYRQSARYPAWRPRPHYRNYPQPRFRYRPPSPFFHSQRTVAKLTK